MKTSILVLLLLCFFSSIGLAQLTPKEKSKPTEEKVTGDTIPNIVTNVTPADVLVSTSSSKLTPKTKEQKKNSEKTASNLTNTSENTSGESESKIIFPLSQVQLFVGYVAYNDYLLNGNGIYGEFTVRQGPNLTEGKYKNTLWGMGVKAGKYQTFSKQFDTDLEKFTTTTKEIGGFISMARVTKRANWNSFVLNLEGKQSVDEGSQGLYRRKQVDILIAVNTWIDLTRKNSNLWFSKTNFSLYYQYPLKTSVSSFYDGERIQDNTWNKKLLFLNFDQTMLQFNLAEVAEKMSINFGFNLGYRHFSQGKKDMYALGVFSEAFYWLCKIVRAGVELIIDPTEKTSRGKNIIFKTDWDLFQVGRAIF